MEDVPPQDPKPAADPPQREEVPTYEMVQPLQGELPPSVVLRIRSRRRRGITKEEARQQLVELSKKKLEIERKNSEVLKQILVALNKIADKIDRITYVRRSDDGAPSN
ncbi:hypothetical protein SFRURICE_004677 [Spodoptera frugiperda]|uniref:SFRICE_000281 n=1 Tax=Spodoptera frugiperda TaxID=7108 RepID=A0A2H1W0G8_SPOFR|nr:hypothetical protein SFRURICE_004677 [Spodoptera frugiperda]